MATIISNLTRINDAEGTLTSVSVGGGAGAAANTDIFIQGAQSLGRRQSNVTLNGFLLDDGIGGNNISASGTHIGAWIWVTHYSVLTALRLRLASNSASGNYDEHTIPLTEYPSLGGWIRVWVEVARAPDASGGTGLDETTARYFGPIVSLPTVGGNAANVILDAIDTTTSGLLMTGTSGTWQDFLTADEGSTTNKYGVVTSNSGIIYCKARLQIGNSLSTSFSDSNFTLVFPQQNTVSNSFMGITLGLQNSATTINWNSGVINSPGAKKGDLIVTGGSGTFTAEQVSFNGLRALQMTSSCTLNACTFAGCGQIVQNDAYFVNCTISESIATAATLSSNISLFSGVTFISSGSGHAIEMTTASPTGITFYANFFQGYGASGTTDAAIYNNSGKNVTINVVGNGDTPTIRNGTGASTTVNNAKALTITNIINDSEVRIYAAGTTNELAGQESVTTGSFTYSYNYAAGTYVDIVVFKESYKFNEPLGRLESFLLPSADSSLPINQQFDRNYYNP